MNTGPIKTLTWQEIKSNHSIEDIYIVDSEIILTDVITSLTEDNHSMVQNLIDNGVLFPPTPKQIKELDEQPHYNFFAVHVSPFIFIQSKL